MSVHYGRVFWVLGFDLCILAYLGAFLVHEGMAPAWFGGRVNVHCNFSIFFYFCILYNKIFCKKPFHIPILNPKVVKHLGGCVEESCLCIGKGMGCLKPFGKHPFIFYLITIQNPL